MMTLFIHFNQNGTIKTAALRNSDGTKVQDMQIWELWELYQFLTSAGYEPIVLDHGTGTIAIVRY